MYNTFAVWTPPKEETINVGGKRSSFVRFLVLSFVRFVVASESWGSSAIISKKEKKKKKVSSVEQGGQVEEEITISR